MGKRGASGVCFLSHDQTWGINAGQLLTTRLRVSAVEPDAPLRPSSGRLLEFIALTGGRRWPTITQCHRHAFLSDTPPGGGVAGCDGAPRGTGTHMAAGRRQPRKQHDTRDTQAPQNCPGIWKRNPNWQGLPRSQACRGEDFMRGTSRQASQAIYGSPARCPGDGATHFALLTTPGYT